MFSTRAVDGDGRETKLKTSLAEKAFKAIVLAGVAIGTERACYIAEHFQSVVTQAARAERLAEKANDQSGKTAVDLVLGLSAERAFESLEHKQFLTADQYYRDMAPEVRRPRGQ